MQRPAGVVLLSVFFSCLAGLGAALLGAYIWRHGISNLVAGPEQLIGAMGMVLGALLLGFVAYGLWDLDEDARWVAFAFFAWPALLFSVGFASSFQEWNWDAARVLAMIALFGAPSVYRQLRPVRSCFVQLVLLDLSR